jgi:site-specific recombinase XerD
MKHPLATLFEQFLKERIYLKNVTPKTIIWYQVAFKAYGRALPREALALPTKAVLQQFVIGLRDRGLRPVTCNTYIGAMNAFCGWLHQEGHLGAPLKLKKFQAEKRFVVLMDEAQMKPFRRPSVAGSTRFLHWKRRASGPRRFRCWGCPQSMMQ